MIRKYHLQNTCPIKNGPACKGGRMGSALSGEHITEKFVEFQARPVEMRCAKCAASKLFAVLSRKNAQK